MNALSQLVGNNIRIKRNSLDIRQDELALLAEIDRSYMGRIERGEVNLTLEKLYKICGILECEAADLLPTRDEVSYFQTT